MKKEKDPSGLSASTPGAKLDAGKPRVGLMFAGFPRALLAVAEVTTFGAEKYTPLGWESVREGIDRYNDAKGRHMLKSYIEAYDPDTKLLHMAQEVWNNLAELELLLREKEARERGKNNG